MSKKKINFEPQKVVECVNCDGMVEVYRKSNVCEACFKKFMKEEKELERLEMRRSKWY